MLGRRLRRAAVRLTLLPLNLGGDGGWGGG